MVQLNLLYKWPLPGYRKNFRSNLEAGFCLKKGWFLDHVPTCSSPTSYQHVEERCLLFAALDLDANFQASSCNTLETKLCVLFCVLWRDLQATSTSRQLPTSTHATRVRFARSFCKATFSIPVMFMTICLPGFQSLLWRAWTQRIGQRRKSLNMSQTRMSAENLENSF